MHSPGPRLAAVLTVVVTAASAVVTNLITNRLTWTLAAVFAALLLAAGALAVLGASRGHGSGPRVRQTARGGSVIRVSGITADTDTADIAQAARRGSKIIRSGVWAQRGQVTQTAASDSVIEDSPITVKPVSPDQPSASA